MSEFRGKYQYIQLSVADLLVDPMNPRFEPVSHQNEAIVAMIENQGAKLIELAKDILENGLSPMDIIMIQQHGAQWIVREGNRRVVALKLINEPSLIPNDNQKLKREFQRLNTDASLGLVGSVQCVIVDDEEAAQRWIQLKHTGENKGVGTVEWDGQQTERFRARVTGVQSKHLSFLESIIDHPDIPSAIREKFSNIKSTNLSRLLGDPDIRTAMEIETEKDRYSVSRIGSLLLLMLEDLISEFSVTRIYHKTDRKQYLSELRDRATDIEQFHDVTVQQKTDSEEGNTVQSKADETKAAIQRAPSSFPINRVCLVPRNQNFGIQHPRLTRIFNELKQMNCINYSNAVAVLFRVFVELSLDNYISVKGVSGLHANSKLHQKVSAVAVYMESHAIMTNNELRIARQMADGETNNHSIKTFHAYVHNLTVTPSAVDLKKAWEDISPFIRNLWR